MTDVKKEKNVKVKSKETEVKKEVKPTAKTEKSKHPELKEVKVGDSILLVVKSCSDTIVPSISRENHPAWSGKRVITTVHGKKKLTGWDI